MQMLLTLVFRWYSTASHTHKRDFNGRPQQLLSRDFGICELDRPVTGPTSAFIKLLPRRPAKSK